MNKRKLRRVAIVALVLVLLCNTLGVQASTKKDDPKGVCRAGGGKAGDSETSTTGSTAFSDRITEDLQEKAGSYRSSGVQEVGGMSEPRMRYEDNLHHYALQQEIASLERHIHHDIDNWEMDMSKDLLDELKDLEKKCRSVNQRMKKDIARNS